MRGNSFPFILVERFPLVVFAVYVFFGLMLQAVYGNPPKRSLQACSVIAWQSFFFLFWVDSKEEITTSLTLCKGDGS